MLIPQFQLDQDQETVTATIRAPYCDLAELDVHVDGDNFVFWCSPYLLNLRLPAPLAGSTPTESSFNSDDGTFSFTLKKANPGEHFDGLDLITSLLQTKKKPDINPPLIEVIGDNTPVIDEDEDSSTSSSLIPNNFSYGFANKVAGQFKDCGSEFTNVFELPSPDETSFVDRRTLREEKENEKFSSDHYLADFFDEELIEPLLDYKAPWESLSGDSTVKFSSEEIDVLKDLPNKEYLLTESEYHSVLCNLVDILFAYCYEKRTTFNEDNVESSWTVNRLSSTLSWFETFDNVKETLSSCYRRALIYPIYRNFKLCCKVKDDVTKLFQIGRKYIVKCLIDIYKLFNKSQDARYILNQFYIKDFLIFTQKSDKEKYDKIYKDLCDTIITKNCLHLELEEYEEAGSLVKIEEAQILENSVAIKLASMNLNQDEEKKQVRNNNVKIETSCLDSSDSDDSSSDWESSSSDDETSSSLSES